MERNRERRSCGAHGSRARCAELPREPFMSLLISCTTGTRLELAVPLQETVDELKKRLSQKLTVPKDRLTLLHRDTRLNSGKLQDFGVTDGSRLTLVPTVEAGLMSHSWRAEHSVLRALEGLTDAQVSDFLSGRSPLTLALRVGDHMMFVQLQLAAQQSHHTPSVSRDTCQTPAAPGRTQSSPASPSHSSPPHQNLQNRPSPPPTPCSPPHSPTHHTRHAQSGSSPTPDTPCQVGGKQNCNSGAVIESLVNHAPGVFSGTFSGTLHPSCQDGSGRPRRDISTILQILNDLLNATRHFQSSPPTLTHLHCQSPSPPHTPTANPHHPTSHTPDLLHVACGEHLRQTENKATRCKVEQLQLLLQQKRLRRKARRDTRGPYHWPSDRRPARAHRNASLSSDGSLDLDYEEPVWKPDVQSDINTEFVVA